MSQRTARTRSYELWLSPSRRIRIVLRRFRVAPERRSTHKKQFVFDVNSLNGYKQVAAEVRYKKTADGTKRRLQLALSSFILVFGLGGIVLFGQVVFGTKSIEPVQTYAVPVLEAEPQTESSEPADGQWLDRSQPQQIILPRVGIDAPIETVGLNSDNTMQTPDIYSEATGWYKFGPSPGEVGPAVIVGHVDNLDGPSVFWKLREVRLGDTIAIERADGETVKFRVSGVEQFEQTDFPTQKVYGATDKPTLRLITCGGVYSAATDSYSHNTVVFAEII